MTGADLAHHDLIGLAAMLRQRQISATELMDYMLTRIETLQPQLHAFVYLDPDIARQQARKADAQLAAGTCGPLAGIPIAVKDLFWTVDMPTSAEMPIRRNFYAPRDATVIERLRRAGALVFGKLAMPEGAAITHHPDFGPPPVNPWRKDLWTGVSSSGCGVAVAAGMSFAAIGSDTGGSIRFPSAMNGLTGLMPSWGRVSRHGTVALAPSLDHMGPMARNARDVALVYSVIAGKDPADPTSWPWDPVAVDIAADHEARGLRVGYAPQACVDLCEKGVTRALDEVAETLRQLGASLVTVELPALLEEARKHAFLLIGVEAAVAHRETYAQHAERYGQHLRNLIEAGRHADVMEYERACVFRRHLRGAIDALLAGLDVLILPVMPYAAPTVERLGSLAQEENPNTRMMTFTVPFNLGGQPTITLPCRPMPDGSPLGFQLVAARGREDLLLRAAIAFQTETSWHARRPTFPAQRDS